MRISFSGSANTGKSTLTKQFLNRWPMYSTPSKTYRDVIIENNLQHSSNTNEETQLLILDWMMAEQLKFPKGSKIVYDRSPWDNLAYTLYGNLNGIISDEVTAATISLVRESMRHLDIIFWIKYNDNIKIVNDNLRDTDPEYIKQTDAIFSQLFDHYMENLEDDVFYPKEDCPAIICIDENFSSIDDRLMFISEFIDKNGNLIETENSILDPSNAEFLENMLMDQTKQLKNEENIKQIIKGLSQ